MKPIDEIIGTVDLTVGGETPSLQVCNNYDWSIAPNLTGTAGSSEYTILVSQDDSNFFEYKEGISTTSVNNAFQDNYFAWTYLKVSVTAGGTGDATFNFLGKPSN